MQSLCLSLQLYVQMPGWRLVLTTGISARNILLLFVNFTFVQVAVTAALNGQQYFVAQRRLYGHLHCLAERQYFDIKLPLKVKPNTLLSQGILRGQ